MKISHLLSAYKQSLDARAAETQELEGKVARLNANLQAKSTDRMLSRLGLIKHRLATINSRHRAAACWVATVATPLLHVLSKHLGGTYRANLVQISESLVSLRFACTSHDHIKNGIKGLNLRLYLKANFNAGAIEVDLEVETEIVRVNQDIPARFKFGLDLPVQQLLEA